MLMPVNTSALRRSLDEWFDSVGVAPRIVAEFADSALLKAFGEAGIGIFPAPSAISAQIEDMYHARCIGTTGDIKESFFAISPERKLKHPAVVKITESARARLFS
jgi:LysR family transcriptional activator of nhaA